MDLAAYGLIADHQVRLAGGYTADCYRVGCGTDDYLVKAWRPEAPDRSSALALLGILHDVGLPVVPPEPTRVGTLTATTADGTVAVFRYVHGVPAPDWSAWTDDLLVKLGAILADVHRVDVSHLTCLARDPLHVPQSWPVASNPELAAYAGEVAAQLRRLAAIRPEPYRPVLCHTDLAGDNVLFTDSGLVVLDWDEAVIGPAEMDFMLIARPNSRPFARVLDGYRAAGGDTTALSLARLEFCMLRRYLADAAVRIVRIEDPHATEQQQADAFADFQTWGVGMWRRLDRAIDAVAPLLGP